MSNIFGQSGGGGGDKMKKSFEFEQRDIATPMRVCCSKNGTS